MIERYTHSAIKLILNGVRVDSFLGSDAVSRAVVRTIFVLPQVADAPLLW